jgi:malonyl-CoA O-methyltransferase
MVFAEVLRVLKPGGLWVYATFGPDTLKELRAAWQAVDARVHVHEFIDMHDLGDVLLGSGFADPVLDVERLVLTYPDVRALLRDLKQLGAHNADRSRARGLTGKRHFRQFEAAYQAFLRDGQVPATYEVVFGHAWAPQLPRLGAGAVAGIPVAALRRRT